MLDPVLDRFLSSRLMGFWLCLSRFVALGDTRQTAPQRVTQFRFRLAIIQMLGDFFSDCDIHQTKVLSVEHDVCSSLIELTSLLYSPIPGCCHPSKDGYFQIGGWVRKGASNLAHGQPPVSGCLRLICCKFR